MPEALTAAFDWLDSLERKAMAHKDWTGDDMLAYCTALDAWKSYIRAGLPEKDALVKVYCERVPRSSRNDELHLFCSRALPKATGCIVLNSEVSQKGPF
jgi:hypothetical protein